MSSIGFIEFDRLANIPPRHWKTHEFCFYLHDQLLHMLVQYEQSGAHNSVVEAFRNAVKGHEEKFEDVDILDFLKKHALVKPYEHHILSHVSLGIMSDMLNFLYEALTAFEKRKFSVGFSLLRKPLKEHLFFLCWLLADSSDFISRFEANNHETLNHVSKDRKIQIFSDGIQKLATPSLFSADLVWNMVYSKNHTNSFEPVFQKATHLVTSMGDLLKTEDYSLNFIFEHPYDDYFFDRLYSNLPYLLILAIQIGLEAFNRIHEANKLTYSHLIITTMGCYEALFMDGRSQRVAKMLNNTLKELLNCAHCKAKIRITKKNAVGLFLQEHAVCSKCGLLSPVPLYWLFGLANLNVVHVGDEEDRAKEGQKS